jgi:hypothetical protein
MQRQGLRADHLDEYRNIFDLSDTDLNASVFEYSGQDLNAINGPDHSFDLALCAHHLFVNSALNQVDRHLDVIQHLARIAKEVRIFPLVAPDGELSPLLGPVLLGLQQAQYGVEVREVKGGAMVKGQAMLRVWAQECPLVCEV